MEKFMNLVPKDFVTAKGRIETKKSVKIKRGSPLHLVRIRIAAEDETLKSLNLRVGDKISDHFFNERMIDVLCQKLAVYETTEIEI
jgi:hypothetical protein